jgi:hypothetical protein
MSPGLLPIRYLAAAPEFIIHARHDSLGPPSLLNDVEFDLCDPTLNHPERVGRRMRDIDNPSRNVRTAVIDPNDHGPPGPDVCHPQPGTKRQRRMSGSQIVRVELFATRGLLALCVEACNSLRGDLCRGRIVGPRERRMLFHGCDMTVGEERRGEERCRSIALQRRRMSNRGGLGTGRKRRSPENDDKQSKDVPDTSARDRGSVRNRIFFSSDAPTLGIPGTIDGIHLHPQPVPPSQTPPAKRAEPWLAGIGPGDSMGV